MSFLIKGVVMRRISVLSVALLVAVPAVANNVVGKSYRTNHSVFGAASPERVAMARSDRMERKDEGKGGSLELVGLWSRSSAEQDLRDYYLPAGGKTKLVAGELGSDAYIAGTSDILASYFNVNTAATSGTNFTSLTFQSELTFHPRQSVMGVGLQWQQQFKGWFFKVSAPVVKVTNDLRMTEEVIEEGGGAVPSDSVGTMVDAFKQEAMLYGKIDGKREKWGVADVELVVGRNWLDEDKCQVSSYLGLVVPTGKKPNAEYLAEAVVGNNGHFGLMFGSEMRHTWKEGDNYTLSICCESNGRYLFENTQKRSVDLQGRPWSRYIWLTKSDAGSFTGLDFGSDLEYGVNILTQDVKVSPRGAFTANTALNFRRENGLELEAGFNFYARQAEEVVLKEAFANADEYGIPALDNSLNGWQADESCSFATIKNAYQELGDTDLSSGNEVFNPIAEADLDLNSAAHPAVIENTFYGVVGMNWDECRFPAFASAGGSYTYSADNAGTSRWAVFAKLGLSF